MLTAEQIEHFERSGYLVVNDLLDEDRLGAIQSEYEAAVDALYADWFAGGVVGENPESLGFWDKIGQCLKSGEDWYQPLDISLPHTDIRHDTPMHFGPAVFAMIRAPRILDAVEQLIGPEISSNPIQHVRIKPPQEEVPADEIRAHVISTDWHQDMGVTLPEADDTKFVTVWLAITDATVENGCLQVASGDYDAVLPHCASSQVGIAAPFVPRERAIPVPIPAGGAVIFHPLTPHASLANLSDGYRWSFDLRYHVTGQPSGRSHFPEFVARSRRDPSSELQDWREWRARWETARSTLSKSAHISQHGRWGTNSSYCA